jgi:transcriptional regulator with XRE-family HTH domain
MLLKPKGNEITRCREKSGFTRHGLSKKAGLGGSAVERMEKGLHMVHPLRAKAVADVLKCNVEELFEEVEKSEGGEK